MRWVRAGVRTLIWTLTVLVVLAVGGVFFLTRTDPGIRLVVEEGLERLERTIEGSVRVEGVESADLLEGALLLGLEIRDAEGRDFARVDSLRIEYSIAALLRGDVILDEVEARGITVTLEQLPGQEEMNASRIFASGAPEADTARSRSRPGADRRILLRNLEIGRGEVLVRLPVEDPEALPDGAYTAPGPGEDGLLRQYRFRELEAELPRVSIAMPGQEGEIFRLARLSTVAEIQGEPVRLTRLRGDIRRVGARLTLDAGRIELPDSRATGDVVVDWSDGGMVVDADLRAEPVVLSEFRWLAPRLPDARTRGPVGLRISPDSTTFTVDGTEFAMDDGTMVRARGGIRLAPELGFRDLRLDLSPLPLRRLDPWLEEPLPLRGRATGNLQVDGTLEVLAVGGELTLHEEGVRPTTARISGVVGLGERRGVQGLQIDVAPLDYALIERIWPERQLRGTGSLLVEADGWFDQGMRLIVDLEHEASGLSRSRIEAVGTVRSDSAEVYLDLEGEVDPIDLGALRGVAPELDLGGEVEGPVRITGRLGDLRVETALETRAGRFALDASFDARDPAAGYRIDGEVEDLRLSDLFGSLPNPTTLTGTVSARGRGLDRRTAQGRGRVRLRDSRMARLEVDSATLELDVEGGTVRIDTLEARTNVARFQGGGRLGLTEASPEGRIRVAFQNDSLQTVRPFLFGDTVIAADTLSPLEREVLELEGVDPDTLPTQASIGLSGRLSGEATLEGWIEDFSVEGQASAREIVYGSNFLRGADLTFSGSGLPDLEGDFEGTLEVDSVRWLDRSFAGGRLEFGYTRPGGRVLLELERSPTEDYRARAAFEADSLGGVVHLDELVVRLESARWNLGGPATVEWGPEGIRVRDFRLIRPGRDRMRIRADGLLPREGPADFDLDIERLRLEQVADLLQTEEAIGGLVDLALHVGGTARSPVASGTLLADSLRFRNVSLSRVEGDVEYADRQVRGTLQAWRETLLAARIEGSFPVDLTLREVEERIPSEPMDIRAVVDFFPVAVLATMLQGVEEVTGTVSGEARFTGTPAEVRPSGSFELHGGSFRLPALGIRPTEVAGTVELTEDDRARIDLRGRSRGNIRVQGTMALNPVTDPTFDLSIDTEGFQAVDRRDIQGRVGGRMTLTGRYTRPQISGSARVDEGVLRIEEFERSAEVVDLSDPRFFDVVDTSFVAEPTLQQGENPFLQNLQVEVDLRVQRSWLRSREMNVEMGGNLTINWNRSTRDLVLTGQLSAIRGTYRAFQRQFQVREGTVEFVGTPGLNPGLSIEAFTRLRTVQGEPLAITATVSGTLQEPRVELSSDAQPPIAESDLVSYLIFGRPSFALGSGESAVLQRSIGAAGEAFLGVAASQLASAAVQEVGVDYLAVTQTSGNATGTAGGLSSTVASTQLEAGWYFWEDVFFSLLLRPLVGVGSTGAATQSRLAGMRAEWQLGDVWTVQGFWEDRFSREQLVGFGDLAFRLSKIFGFFIYRDWGY